MEGFGGRVDCCRWAVKRCCRLEPAGHGRGSSCCRSECGMHVQELVMPCCRRHKGFKEQAAEGLLPQHLLLLRLAIRNV